MALTHARQAVRARQLAGQAQRRGLLIPGPCEFRRWKNCAGRVEKHHDSYAHPLQVRWVCKRHHILLERGVEAYLWSRLRKISVLLRGLPLLPEEAAMSDPTYTLHDAGYLDLITRLLATGKYDWARATLEGIAATVRERGSITLKQREAVDHIMTGRLKHDVGRS